MAPSPCENCHKRPKFGTHRFCGKTCAMQAASKHVRSKHLQPNVKGGPRNAGRQGGPPPIQWCIYCGQKPRFNGFDYCGKSCAALANVAQTKPSTTKGVPTIKQKTTHATNAPPSSTIAQGRVPAKGHGPPRAKAPVTQTDDSTEEDEESEEEGDGTVSTDLDAYPSDSGSELDDEPSVSVAAVPQPKTKSKSSGGKSGGSVPRIIPGTCAIPGCEKPSHVDRNGLKTMYCSIKHREEAVRLGLEAACIMCRKYPQTSSDYFCSAACRNQSMVKT